MFFFVMLILFLLVLGCMCLYVYNPFLSMALSYLFTILLIIFAFAKFGNKEEKKKKKDKRQEMPPVQPNTPEETKNEPEESKERPKRVDMDFCIDESLIKEVPVDYAVVAYNWLEEHFSELGAIFVNRYDAGERELLLPDVYLPEEKAWNELAALIKNEGDGLDATVCNNGILVQFPA